MRGFLNTLSRSGSKALFSLDTCTQTRSRISLLGSHDIVQILGIIRSVTFPYITTSSVRSRLRKHPKFMLTAFLSYLRIVRYQNVYIVYTQHPPPPHLPTIPTQCPPSHQTPKHCPPTTTPSNQDIKDAIPIPMAHPQTTTKPTKAPELRPQKPPTNKARFETWTNSNTKSSSR
jgi:hypothetical protein